MGDLITENYKVKTTKHEIGGVCYNVSVVNRKETTITDYFLNLYLCTILENNGEGDDLE